MHSVRSETVRTENCSEQIYDRHCHTDFEILFVLRGSILLNLEGVQLRLRENTGVIIAPMKYHVVTGDDSSYHRLILTFGSEAVPGVILEKFRKAVLEYALITDGPMIEGLQRYAEITEKRDPVFAPLEEALLTQILYGLTFGTSAAGTEAENKRAERLRQITSFVERNLHREISLGEIAARLYVSESSLCHFFRQDMNISLKQYILQKKMIYAKSLLETGTPPTTAAQLCGYKNYASFYKIFLKVTGQTPGQVAERWK